MMAPTDARRSLGGPALTDVAIVAVVAIIGQQEAWAPFGGHGWSHTVGPRPALAAAYLLSALALLWRRRAPLVVVAVVTGVLSAEYLVFGASDGLGCLLPPALAFYAAGRYGDPSRFGGALLLTAAGLAVHEWRDPQFSFMGPTVVVWAVLLSSGIIGRVFNTTTRDLEAMARRASQLEEERDERARAAVAAERARITRDLHDLVGHGISLMVLQLVAAQGNLECGQVEPARERLARLESTARSTLAEMRRLVAVTDEEPTLSPQPGLADIPVLVADVRSSGGAVSLVMPALIDPPAGVGLAAYRVVQEALTNVIKHAPSGAEAAVEIALAGGALLVEITDSGTEPIGDLGNGRGLTGMRERVALYGGTLEVGPGPHGGFRVHARFPLEGEPA